MYDKPTIRKNQDTRQFVNISVFNERCLQLSSETKCPGSV